MHTEPSKLDMLAIWLNMVAGSILPALMKDGGQKSIRQKLTIVMPMLALSVLFLGLLVLV